MQKIGQIKRLVKRSLKEDVPRQDITSNLFVSKKDFARANLIAKQDLIICGLDLATIIFKKVDKSLTVENFYQDGDKVAKKKVILTVQGNKRSILKAERVVLNFLQHLSGIATATDKLRKIINSPQPKLLDTRKTLPGLRVLQKYAVKVGGGENHRMSLSDMVLIKENHIHGLNYPQIKEKIQKARKKGYKVEIECNNFKDLKQFLTFSPDIIMLDNMSVDSVKKAIQLRSKLNSSVKFEVSGNITATNLKSYARTGVDFISTGSLTHSVKAADISLLIQ